MPAPPPPAWWRTLLQSDCNATARANANMASVDCPSSDGRGEGYGDDEGEGRGDGRRLRPAGNPARGLLVRGAVPVLGGRGPGRGSVRRIRRLPLRRGNDP